MSTIQTESIDKKKKPPKPGSKKAQLMGKALVQFQLPNVYIHDTTLFLLFQNSKDLKLGFGNAHNYYEKRQLKGPLKGINMPFSVYQEWKQVSILTIEEQQIDEIVGEPVYIIASLEKDKSTLLHEWAHAFYYYESSYRDFISQEWANLEPKLREAIIKELQMRNYEQDVFQDEFQAYIRENPSDFGKKYTHQLSKLHQKLKELVQMPELVPFHKNDNNL